MKKSSIFTFITMIILVFLAPLSISAQEVSASETVILDGAKITDGRTLVPLRSIFEEIGATVHYESKNRKITAEKDGRVITLNVDSKHTNVNGQHVVIDVPATVQNGRTLVPLRFVSESFGAIVKWNSEAKQATISLGGKEILVNVFLTEKEVMRTITRLTNEINDLVNVRYEDLKNPVPPFSNIENDIRQLVAEGPAFDYIKRFYEEACRECDHLLFVHDKDFPQAQILGQQGDYLVFQSLTFANDFAYPETKRTQFILKKEGGHWKLSDYKFLNYYSY